jgi:diguanylate cyclase (GGDEF)-like protein
LSDTGAVALLDAIPDITAVIRGDGTIVGVNRAWRMFALDNGGDPTTTGLGANYFAACERAARAGCPEAAAAESGLHAVLEGGSLEWDLEYACASPSVGRWFVMRATLIAGPEPAVLVSHMNITRRKMAEQDLERKASEDPLTGLANRALFARRLTSALKPRTTRSSLSDVGLLYIDLDGFKHVNDTYGHAAGDELLQAIASRLHLLSRPQDTVARLGGDEFAVLAPRITADGLAALAARIEAALTQPHLIHNHPIAVGASVGLHLAAPGESASESLHRADEAMYAIKRAQANQSVLR